MKTIFIIGFMTAGKSREGKRLAKLMKMKFIDLDRVIEANEKRTVSEIFTEKGEEYFRAKEGGALRAINTNENCIVSCGGGTPCFFDNMNWMLKQGIVVWLKISTEEILKRVGESKKKRPLLNNLNGVKLINFIQEKYNEREVFYSKAPIQINTENISIENLMQMILSYKNEINNKQQGD